MSISKGRLPQRALSKTMTGTLEDNGDRSNSGTANGFAIGDEGGGGGGAY